MSIKLNDFDELIHKLTAFDKMYDITRVVNPNTKEVVFIRKDEELENINLEESCYDFWQRDEVCSNCISMRAYNENDTFMKVESSTKEIKMVTAIPIIIEGEPLVVELLKDITSSMILDGEKLQEGVVVKHILEQANLVAVRDELTDTYNKRYIKERLPNEIVQSKLKNNPLSIIIADIDHFKIVNDTYGHIAGDYILKEFAKILKENIREDRDFVARFGGEEFIICLVDITKEEAIVVAERIRRQIQDNTFDFNKNEIKITSSFGVFTNVKEPMSVNDLIEAADKRLYEAKKTGRNRVVS